MATSSNATIQQYMNEVDALDANDSNLEAKLAEIAQKIAAEQQRVKAALTGQSVNDSNLIDPADAFACEGCQ